MSVWNSCDRALIFRVQENLLWCLTVSSIDAGKMHWLQPNRTLLTYLLVFKSYYPLARTIVTPIYFSFWRGRRCFPHSCSGFSYWKPQTSLLSQCWRFVSNTPLPIPCHRTIYLSFHANSDTGNRLIDCEFMNLGFLFNPTVKETSVY